MAIKLREIANQFNQKHRIDRVGMHKIYAQKLYDSKLTKKAKKGWHYDIVKVGKKYSAFLTKTALEDMGFSVHQSSKDGRQYLTIKW
jgi:hypothetical protein